jgi:hypothetical protein
MKLSAFSALLLVFVLTTTQAAMAEIGEPEYVGTYVALDVASGRYIQLERRTPVATYRRRGLWGIGGARSNMWVPGSKSSVRFLAGQKIQLIFKVDSQDQDPQSFIQFNSLVAKGDRRMLPTMAVGSLFTGRRRESVTYKYAVPFVATKRGRNFFTIEPATPLVPGEYWISASADAFCFGVDP